MQSTENIMPAPAPEADEYTQKWLALHRDLASHFPSREGGAVALSVLAPVARYALDWERFISNPDAEPLTAGEWRQSFHDFVSYTGMHVLSLVTLLEMRHNAVDEMFTCPGMVPFLVDSVTLPVLLDPDPDSEKEP